VSHEFIALFCCGVQGDGVVYFVVGTVGDFFVGSVDRGRGSVYQMFDTLFAVVVGMTTGFQDVVEADQVGLDVSIRICDGVADARLSR